MSNEGETYSELKKYRPFSGKAGAASLALLVLFIIGFAIALGLAIAYSEKLRNTDWQPTSNALYSIQYAPSLGYLGNCTTCYDSPSDCLTYGGAVIDSALAKIRFTVSTVAGQFVLQDTNASAENYWYATTNNSICTGLLQGNGYSSFIVETVEKISEGAAIVVIKNVGNGFYLAPCTSNCIGVTSGLSVFAFATKAQVMDGTGFWIMRYTT